MNSPTTLSQTLARQIDKIDRELHDLEAEINSGNHPPAYEDGLWAQYHARLRELGQIYESCESLTGQ